MNLEILNANLLNQKKNINIKILNKSSINKTIHNISGGKAVVESLKIERVKHVFV